MSRINSRVDSRAFKTEKEMQRSGNYKVMKAPFIDGLSYRRDYIKFYKDASGKLEPWTRPTYRFLEKMTGQTIIEKPSEDMNTYPEVNLSLIDVNLTVEDQLLKMCKEGNIKEDGVLFPFVAEDESKILEVIDKEKIDFISKHTEVPNDAVMKGLLRKKGTKARDKFSIEGVLSITSDEGVFSEFELAQKSHYASSSLAVMFTQKEWAAENRDYKSEAVEDRNSFSTSKSKYSRSTPPKEKSIHYIRQIPLDVNDNEYEHDKNERAGVELISYVEKASKEIDTIKTETDKGKDTELDYISLKVSYNKGDKKTSAQNRSVTFLPLMGYTPSKNIKEQPVMFNKTLSFDKVEEIFRGAFDIKDQLIFFEPMSASDYVEELKFTLEAIGFKGETIEELIELISDCPEKEDIEAFPARNREILEYIGIKYPDSEVTEGVDVDALIGNTLNAMENEEIESNELESKEPDSNDLESMVNTIMSENIE